jgi:hypothetical protein
MTSHPKRPDPNQLNTVAKLLVEAVTPAPGYHSLRPHVQRRLLTFGCGVVLV